MTANWRTTLSGIGAAIFALLSMLAVAPYSLGELATIIPPEYKSRILVASAVAAFLLRTWNSVSQKDRQVTGGSVQQTISGNIAEPGTQTLVDQTLIASKASGETLTPEQHAAVKSAEAN